MILSGLGDMWVLFILVAACLLAAGLFWGALRRSHARELGEVGLASKISLPWLKEERRLVKVLQPRRDFQRKRKRQSPVNPPGPATTARANPQFRELLENLLSWSAVSGDFAMIVLGFCLAGRLCEGGLIFGRISSVPLPSLAESYKLILAGAFIVLWGLTGRGLYHYRSLLMPAKIWHWFVEALGSCLLALVFIGLLVRTDPPIPWVFYVGSAVIIFLNIYIWRMVLGRIARHPILASRLRRRLVVIGGGLQTRRIQRALEDNGDMEFIGWVQANKPNQVAELEEFRLGALHELEAILRQHAANIAVLTESESLHAGRGAGRGQGL